MSKEQRNYFVITQSFQQRVRSSNEHVPVSLRDSVFKRACEMRVLSEYRERRTSERTASPYVIISAVSHPSLLN